MSDIETHPSIFTESQLPSFLVEDAPQFVRFIELYYQWMEQFDNPRNILRKYEYYRDVDRIPSKFYMFLRSEFMKNIPQKIAVSEEILFKNIKDFYLARGSEQATKLLFKILYNEDITIYYPGVDIFRSSDGTWYVEKSLYLDMVVDFSVINNVKRILGTDTNTSARIESSLSYIDNGVQVYEVILTNIFGNFSQYEPIIDRDTDTLLGYVKSNGLVVKPGRYLTTDSFSSSDKYLQDSFYYQEYSYEIKSSKSIVEYREFLDKLTHVSGTKAFGSILIQNDFDIFTNADAALELTDFTRIIYVDLDVNLDFSIGSDVGTSEGGASYIFELFIDFTYGTTDWSTSSDTETLYYDLIPLTNTIESTSNNSLSWLDSKDLSTLVDVPFEEYFSDRLIYSASGEFGTLTDEDASFIVDEDDDPVLDDEEEQLMDTNFSTIQDGVFCEFSDGVNNIITTQIISKFYNEYYARLLSPYQYPNTSNIAMKYYKLDTGS